MTSALTFRYGVPLGQTCSAVPCSCGLIHGRLLFGPDLTVAMAGDRQWTRRQPERIELGDPP
jgi:hypothetical protein